MCKCSQALHLLVIFSIVFTVIFLDRGSWAVTMGPIQKNFKLSNTETGIIGGIFMAGYTVASILFAHLSNHHPPLKLMAWGIGIWTVASIACGFAIEFWSLLVGFGEAAYLVLAPPMLDAIAPSSKRTQWIGYFFLSLPIGYALGNALAGLWVGANVLEEKTWRCVYWIQAVLMFPLFFITIFSSGPSSLGEKKWTGETQYHAEVEAGTDMSVDSPSIQPEVLKHDDESSVRKRYIDPNTPKEATSEELFYRRDNLTRRKSLVYEKERLGHDVVELPNNEISFGARLQHLFTHAIFMCLALGYCAQTFVIGGIATYTIQYQINVLHFKVGFAGAVFGVITLLMGVIGIWFGAWCLDYLRRNDLDDDMKSTEWSAQQMLIFVAIALPFAIGGFIIAPKYPHAIFAFLAPAEFFMFGTVAPVNAAFMWCVDAPYRSLAVALSAFLQHALGDALSPIIIGLLIDYLKDMTQAMLIACSWLGWTLIFWLTAWLLLKKENSAIQKAWVRSIKDSDDEDDLLKRRPVESETYNLIPDSSINSTDDNAKKPRLLL